MTVRNTTGIDWSHPPSRDVARARLIGRRRYNELRQTLAGERADIVFELLVQYGWDHWGTLTKIAGELGVHKSTVCRDRQRIERSMPV